MSDLIVVSGERVRLQIEAILRAWGMDEPKLPITSELMVEADLRAIDSHGVSMLTQYESMFRDGRLALTAEPRVVRDRPTTALIDGAAGLGQPVAKIAMALAIDKALQHDVGVVSVFNSHHFGAAGLYAEMAAHRGLIGLVSTTTSAIAVVPTFGIEPRLGTNPFAFAAPSGRHGVVMIDMSTSVVAANKVKVYALAGKPLPAGWVIDRSGAPMSDAETAFDLIFKEPMGGLNPLGGGGTELGGHKGYGLGVFVQILSGTLGGGAFAPLRALSTQAGDPHNIGHFFMALHPEAFRPPGAFEADMDAMVDILRATQPADPSQPVLIPGEPEVRARAERLQHGIPMQRTLWIKLRDVAERAQAPFLLG